MLLCSNLHMHLCVFVRTYVPYHSSCLCIVPQFLHLIPILPAIIGASVNLPLLNHYYLILRSIYLSIYLSLLPSLLLLPFPLHFTLLQFHLLLPLFNPSDWLQHLLYLILSYLTLSYFILSFIFMTSVPYVRTYITAAGEYDESNGESSRQLHPTTRTYAVLTILTSALPN